MTSNSGVTPDDAVSAAVKGVFRSMETGTPLQRTPEHCRSFASQAVNFAVAGCAGVDNEAVPADHAYEAMAAAAISMLLALAHFPRFDEVTELKPSDIDHQ